MGPCTTSRGRGDLSSRAAGWLLATVPCHRCGNESSERSGDWSEVTQQANSRAGRKPRAPASQPHYRASERLSKLRRSSPDEGHPAWRPHPHGAGAPPGRGVLVFSQRGSLALWIRGLGWAVLAGTALPLSARPPPMERSNTDRASGGCEFKGGWPRKAALEKAGSGSRWIVGTNWTLRGKVTQI